MSRALDVVVYGATGLTGRLFCDFFSKNYSQLKWGLAGNDRDHLEELKRKLKLKNDLALFEANVDDLNRLRYITEQTKVLVNLAGPYVLTGTNILEACVETETHYVDIAAELPFIRKSIDLYQRDAEKKQLKIVHSCGVDAIPADLGVYLISEEFKKRNWKLDSIRLIAEEVKGTMSIGTIHSALEAYEMSSIIDLVNLSNPFFLNPRDTKTHNPILPIRDRGAFGAFLSNARDSYFPGFDWALRSFTAPYFLQMIDTRIVNRSNALLNWKYGQSFVFYERMKARGIIVALLMSILYFTFHVFAFLGITRKIIKMALPDENRHVKQEVLDNGYFKFKLIAMGSDEGGRPVQATGKICADHGDPGYRQTSKMVAECAYLLSQETDQLPKYFGVLTPAVAFGEKLKDRLIQRGIQIEIRP